MTDRPQKIGELRETDYRPRSVKEELRANLIDAVAKKRDLFQGIVGYETTVLPQIENAILSGQDIIFLGERGQAKTRIARRLIELLDPAVPAIAGCEINDDPFAPICAACRYRIANDGESVELVWLTPDQRYTEKLATPDISVADLIGEVDPIKVAEGRYLSDELTIHYGLVPRTHRGIFALNELPDLAERVQVSLLNVMEERDVQIRGYKVRLHSTSSSSRPRTPRTTRIAVASSRRSRTASARRSARTIQRRSRPRSASWSKSATPSSTRVSTRSCPAT